MLQRAELGTGKDLSWEKALWYGASIRSARGVRLGLCFVELFSKTAD